MTTPQPDTLFLQVFASKIAYSDDGPTATLRMTDWGLIWLECCAVAKQIADAQAMADAATSMVEKTPRNWTEPEKTPVVPNR